jgi:hypothetical protein
VKTIIIIILTLFLTGVCYAADYYYVEGESFIDLSNVLSKKRPSILSISKNKVDQFFININDQKNSFYLINDKFGKVLSYKYNKKKPYKKTLRTYRGNCELILFKNHLIKALKWLDIAIENKVEVNYILVNKLQKKYCNFLPSTSMTVKTYLTTYPKENRYLVYITVRGFKKLYDKKAIIKNHIYLEYDKIKELINYIDQIN